MYGNREIAVTVRLQVLYCMNTALQLSIMHFVQYNTVQSAVVACDTLDAHYYVLPINQTPLYNAKQYTQ